MYDAQDGREPGEQPIEIIAECCANAVLITSDTSSRKPITRMTARLRRRDFRRCQRPSPPLCRNLPDDVERRLQFAQYGGGCDDQCADPDRGRKDPRPSVTRSPQHSLDGDRALRTDQVRKFAE